MFGKRKKASKQVAGVQQSVKKPQAARKVHAALDVIEDMLTVVTASVVLALVLELGNMPAQAQPILYQGIAGRPNFTRLLAVAQNRPLHTASTNADPVMAAAAKGQDDPGCVTTVMNVVAHQDDDLLFINPDITRDIQKHDCIRTVYVTAGDDGRGTDYLLSREAGSEAAYDVMLGSTKPWKYQELTISSGATVTTAAPDGNPNVSLTFLRLPDGNLDGSGFPDTDNESIAKLETGAITSIAAVDGRESYTSAKLTATLEALMRLYAPSQINTQSNDAGLSVADHSDHLTVSAYTTLAATLYTQQIRLKNPIYLQYFVSYPIRSMISNLTSAETSEKAAAFFAYAIHDPGVCLSMEQCADTGSSYGLYLSRQYTSDH